MSNILPIGTQMISGAVAVPVTVYPGVRVVNFPDNAILRDKVIKHIDICDDYGFDYALSGMEIFKGEIKITLFEKKTQNRIFENLPGNLLSTSIRNGNRLNINHVFDLPMSYITIENNTLVAQQCIYFVFWFDEPAVASPINENAQKSILDFEIELNQTRTYFKENNTLKDAKIRNILLSMQKYTGEGKESISEYTKNRAFITLRRGNLQFIQNVPLYLFEQNKAAYLLNFQNIRFDFTNSYIELVKMENEDYKSVFFNCIIED